MRRASARDPKPAPGGSRFCFSCPPDQGWGPLASPPSLVQENQPTWPGSGDHPERERGERLGHFHCAPPPRAPHYGHAFHHLLEVGGTLPQTQRPGHRSVLEPSVPFFRSPRRGRRTPLRPLPFLPAPPRSAPSAKSSVCSLQHSPGRGLARGPMARRWGWGDRRGPAAARARVPTSRTPAPRHATRQTPSRACAPRACSRLGHSGRLRELKVPKLVATGTPEGLGAGTLGVVYTWRS